MSEPTETPGRDTCDRMLRNVDPPALSERQLRFLAAFAERPTIAVAARLACVHRATVHRWLKNAGFAAALGAAYEVFFRANRAKALAEEAVRRHWREERELERRPMRCHFLALARAAKRH